MNKYFIRELEQINYGPGRGYGRKYGVFQIVDGNEEQIGEYDRNYNELYDTFFPFQLNGRDLALYSPDYTSTRIMELPSCLDLGGEPRDEMGFCPVEYFIPTYLDQEIIHESNNEALPPRQVSKNRVNNPRDFFLKEERQEHKYTNGITGQECTDVIISRPLTPILYYPFGFVAGCIWGDDSSWKIQFLDLSEADKGMLKREERFGYIELPENQTLKDAINMEDFQAQPNEDWANNIRINIMQTFDLRTGKRVNPLD